ncbi:MAG: hypothetical protein A2X61_14595 [Ignavibacteria bacterium GWB2_35_12]|nr:MAG: hypothetical protein A2X63_01565 [Ignavibacteria bacterium GWA2_35_8]OGU42659.1 MAG: hypothetical protein A2X61_14595 [Ignavibacteria bacterium GWB2_35_12]OGU88284.1 MAG: hypothetical protein A2220_14645 [Ignavibacteria bacterium RIFOXYA2_FULL_35_10]OGV19181.1 MAG: hypothetical protein A2475_15390 [Ignavibacteria bacterium RIFOXYC2_FULL_35_21]
MYKSQEEWNKQVEYDIGTAEAMFSTERYIYCVFMCQLSFEKALKGLWAAKFQEDAPKTHNLKYLATKLNISIPEDSMRCMLEIDSVSVLTRYPEELDKLYGQFTKIRTTEILNNTKKAIDWLLKVKI